MNVGRLTSELPAARRDDVALECGTERRTWSELFAADGLGEPELRIGLNEPNSLRLAARILTALDRGALPVLAHPRWPEALVARAFERAGVGHKWTGTPLGTLLFTSGSTAEPKIVAHTLEAHLASARASGQRTPFGPGDRWLLSLPLCHVGGLAVLFRTLVGGATAVLPRAGSKIVEALVENDVTHVSLVATQLASVLADERATRRLAAARAVLVGGGPCPDALLRRALERGIPVRQTYGMTEFGSQVATSTSDDPFTAGRVLPGFELKIVDDEILVRGPGAFAGYLDGDRLDDPRSDGWFRTGDLGSLDDAERLRVSGRRDLRFISGGENVSPEAIEAAFAEAGHVVVVVSVPDERFGRRPVAFTADGGSLDSIARERLPDFMRPIAWLPLPDESGLKLRRGELERLAIERLR